MSLYLTHRPLTPDQVIGQERLAPLFHAIEQKKFVHAYLFSGPRGTGKTTVSRILSRAIACRNEDDIQAAIQERFPDIFEIDAASNRGIEEIRSLREKIAFSPVIGAAKVYIIDEVHMMTKEAFNALLKTLEEPPAHAYFILATTELHKVPDTIQSRCQHYQFHPIHDEDIVSRLRVVLDKEQITYDLSALEKIAYHANGGMRDALTLTEKCIQDGKLSEETTLLLLGGDFHEIVGKMIDALSRQSYEDTLLCIQSIASEGLDPDFIIKSSLQYCITQLTAPETQHKPDDILNIFTQLLEVYPKLKLAPVAHMALYTLLPRSKNINTSIETSVSKDQTTQTRTAKTISIPEKTIKVENTSQDTPPRIEKSQEQKTTASPTEPHPKKEESQAASLVDEIFGS